MIRLVKCIDCDNHEEKGNFCTELDGGLAFSPESEVVCPKWKAKSEKKAK